MRIPRLALVTTFTLAGMLLSSSGLLAQTPAPAPAAAAQAPAVATPENAAPFVGDWTLATTGSNGPATTSLVIKVDAGKVTAEIASDAMGRIAVTDIKKAGTTLVLSYGFDYQGMAVPVVVTLTPAGEKVTADFDFANGAYQMSGTATKKK